MRCWLLRYTLVGQLGNGYAIVIAKDATTALGVLTRLGRIADAGYKVYSIEPFDAIQITKCFDSNIIVAEGLVSTGEDGVGIESIEYIQESKELIIKTTDGRVRKFKIQDDCVELTNLEIDNVLI